MALVLTIVAAVAWQGLAFIALLIGIPIVVAWVIGGPDKGNR